MVAIEPRFRRDKRWLAFDSSRAAPEPAPIRAELLSTERLEEFAATLAKSQPLLPSARHGRALLKRSRQNASVLRSHYDSIANTTSSRRSVTPAAEWFVDNYHVVERQLQLIRDDLPSGYYRQLPKLADGELAGLPRITGIAWSFVAHTDSHLDISTLVRFVSAYQQVESLTIGELWAIASMLRVVLIENLRRCADRIVIGRAQREEADRLADRLLGSATRPPEPVERVLAAYASAALPRTLAVQLVQRLRDCDPRITPALQRVEELLRAEGLNAEAVVRDELQRQGAANVTVRNIVTSLVQLSALDWSDIVEQLSAVDTLLGLECDFYALDFATRNSYRSAIEDLARHSGRRETQIAQLVIDTTRDNDARTVGAADPGFYLIGPGRARIEVAVGYRRPWRQALPRALKTAGVGGYLLPILLACLGLLLTASWLLPPQPRWRTVLGLALLLLPVSDAVIAILNSAITRVIKPKALPALDLGGLVPEEHRTLVAVPVLLSTRADVEEMVANLESQYLSGARGELYFALLVDGRDADTAETEADGELVAAGREGIARLNERYGPASTGARFLWLHRSRRWNAAQGRWMGWERKRGKLHELNRLLRGADDTSFQLTTAERQKLPPAVRYVFVLDADTQLPHGAAEKLIAKMAHPLNQPHFDAATRRVTQGYGILQPRVTPSLPGAEGASLVQTVLSGTPGLDPYAFAVSDLYQDLFAEGSFTGKGLYDIDAFEKSLAGRIGENSVLSHDLLEGLFARAAVVCDVAVVEPAPDRYDVVSSREHRWARGDWQLLPWLRPRLGRGKEPRRITAVSALGRWKLLDNLRRTLVPVATLLALLFGWLLSAQAALWWTAAILLALAVPPLLPILIAVRDRPRHLKRESERQALRHDLRAALLRWTLSLALLADRAWLMGDAIVRTVARLAVTHRHLLDWTTAAQARSDSRLSLRNFLVRMRGGVLLAVLGACAVLFFAPENFWLAAPWLFLWITAPVLARQISLPHAEDAVPELSADDATYLRLIARRTWRYFEEFVTAEDHFLPPDNFQETPLPILAQRTSPTNIGMYLLSSACAVDFGWLGMHDWVERLEATMGSLGGLEKFRGHFLNWYDTRTTQPLLPSYVSTVDSGNLAGHLLTLANAIESVTRRPLWGAERVSGVRDALRLAPAGSAREMLEQAAAGPPTVPGDVVARIRAVARVARAAPPVATEAASAATDPDWIAVAGGCAFSHLRDLERLASPPLSALVNGAEPSGEVVSLWDLAQTESATAARDLLARLTVVAGTARRLAYEMDFAFLLKPHRMLLSIGFNVAEGRLDSSDYDLLASEARLASFIAIAKRDVPARHWFRLDRRSVALGELTALLSWSGSMFEYLMPSLVMRAPAGSLLDRAVKVAVRAQRDYARGRAIPWGISESAFNTRDLDHTYQYSPFGVPALGLKRGLANDLVVAPYATGLATMVDPTAAAANFRILAESGGLGYFGFYEALDFTPERLADGETVAIVRAYMSHHQGMTIVGIANALTGGAAQGYFHAEAVARASELLLQEKPPRSVEDAPQGLESEAREARFPVWAGRRRLQTWRPRTPHTQLIGNGRYAVMVSASGAGFSRCGNLAVTRWSEDATRDQSGHAVFLRDCDSGEVWSGGFAPAGVKPDSYRISFAEDRVEIARRDGPWATRLQVLVSAEHDAEARRLSISNQGDVTREIEITSYAEVLLTTTSADRAHRAFSNMFVQTEFEPGRQALLAGRRPRAEGDAPVWAAHVAVLETESVGACEYETDRARFLGRDRNISLPHALSEAAPLSGSTGTVLDPVFSLRYRLSVAPGETARITFWTVVAGSRTDVLRITDICRDAAAFDRASTLAWTSARVQLHHLGLDPDEASLFQRLAAHLFYINPALRGGADTLRRNRAGASALWAHGISGDRPIIMVDIDEATDIALVRQLLRAHGYFILKNFPVDLVIVNGASTSYLQDLQSQIESLSRASQQRILQAAQAGGGSVFALRAEVMSGESRGALLAAARVALIARRGTLAEQLDRLEEPSAETAAVSARRGAVAVRAGEARDSQLEFDNGTGGFGSDGREYVVELRAGEATPMPWINVIAQPDFGFQVSASGAGFTWSRNSRENALTVWSNDAVADPPSEAFYVRDDDTGEIWSPTAAPIRDRDGAYHASHGQGYSRFEYSSRGIALELLQFVPRGRSLKVSRLRIRNEGSRARRLSVCAYAEWSLGPSRVASAPFIITERCEQTGALLARNPWNEQFGARTAYLDMADAQTEGTCDRREFLGLDGSMEAPVALRAALPLSGRTGAGLDPCAALLASLDMGAGTSRDVVTFLGQSEDAAGAATEIQAARNLHLEQAFAEVTGGWNELLGRVQVKTPDRALDLLLNRWLPYQTLSCRVWARTAFYQSSGAYGFRDQLQDCMALTTLAPAIAREHLLRAAGRQFLEGDVQHWWMPETGKGVRTHISDDRAWLAYCAAHYVNATGDLAVLDEKVPYLIGEPIPEGASDNYFEPQVSARTDSVYEHCVHALDASLAVGAHGLPLMGGGDWNDGMNLVGAAGRGESVWLGWFLCAALDQFGVLARARGDSERADRWQAHRESLRLALESAGWDGDWYRRGYFDDGAPLGAAGNRECRIDSIAQSWAVLSGIANPARAAHAMAAVSEHLVRREEKQVLLFTPPFVDSEPNPGYIRAYPAGIRENGGQYTHGSIWSLMAFAKLGDGDRAKQLFDFLSPIGHTRDPAEVERYKLEPYAVAADIYAAPAPAARGGWSWYTGAAGWLYRAGLESILGLCVEGNELVIQPCIPREWRRYDITYRHGDTVYDITVTNPFGATNGISHVELDHLTILRPPIRIPLVDDRATHSVRVVMG